MPSLPSLQERVAGKNCTASAAAEWVTHAVVSGFLVPAVVRFLSWRIRLACATMCGLVTTATTRCAREHQGSGRSVYSTSVHARCVFEMWHAVNYARASTQTPACSANEQPLLTVNAFDCSTIKQTRTIRWRFPTLKLLVVVISAALSTQFNQLRDRKMRRSFRIPGSDQYPSNDVREYLV